MKLSLKGMYMILRTFLNLIAIVQSSDLQRYDVHITSLFPGFQRKTTNNCFKIWQIGHLLDSYTIQRSPSSWLVIRGLLIFRLACFNSHL